MQHIFSISITANIVSKSYNCLTSGCVVGGSVVVERVMMVVRWCGDVEMFGLGHCAVLVQIHYTLATLDAATQHTPSHPLHFTHESVFTRDFFTFYLNISGKGRYLANMMNQSVRGGNAALCPITLTTCLEF